MSFFVGFGIFLRNETCLYYFFFICEELRYREMPNSALDCECMNILNVCDVTVLNSVTIKAKS